MEVQAGTAGPLLLAASMHMKAGAHGAALASATEALDMCGKSGNKIGEAQAWQAILGARLAMGEYDNALKAAEAALVTCIHNGDENGRALTLHGIARAHLGKEAYDKALKSGNMALELFRKLENRKFEQAAVDIVVQSQLALGKVDDAVRTSTSAVSSLQKVGERKLAGIVMKSVVLAHMARGEAAQALQVGKTAVDLFLELREHSLHAGMLLEMARVNLMLGDYSAAKEYAESAMPCYKELDDVSGNAMAMEIFGAAEDAQVSSEQAAKALEDKASLLAPVLEAMETSRGSDLEQACEKCYAAGVTYSEAYDFVKHLWMTDNDHENLDMNNFWIDHQPAGCEYHDGKHHSGTTLDRMDMYYFFRHIGSMGYGPGFRLLETGWRSGLKNTHRERSQGLGVIGLKEEHEVWEEKVTWGHAGILDCALHAGMCIPLAGEHSSERKP